jgi:hypothetical protein
MPCIRPAPLPEHTRLGAARFRNRSACLERGDAFGGPYHRSQRTAVPMGVEAAFHPEGTLHPPRVNRSHDPFQVVFPEIGQLERIPGQPPGRGGDDDLAGDGQFLQPCGQIGRAANSDDRLGSAGPEPIASDDQTGGDADTRVQRHSGCRPEFRHHIDQRKSGLDSVLCVMLIRTRVTEIGQHAVTRVGGNVPWYRSMIFEQHW